MSPRLKESWPHSPTEAVLLVQVVWRLHRFRHHRTPEGLRPLLDSLADARTKGPNEPKLRKAARYVDAICSWLPYLRADSCIPRSLTLFWVAQRYGCEVAWVCGVKRDAGKLAGHAWLERDGAPFLEPDTRAAGYTVTFRYPDAPTPPRTTPS